MTARIAALLARLPWTPRQLAHAFTVGLLAGVAAVLVLAAAQRSWNRDGATVLLALVAVFLIGEVARAARWLVTDLRRGRRRAQYSRDRQTDFNA
ncbi:hypothetical protein [Micromonospora sediminicola]|uniref:hypothetical protein n=1 Tax=Micromonospora sediminicola TaxID=946078 RepID=UPI00378B317F